MMSRTYLLSMAVSLLLFPAFLPGCSSPTSAGNAGSDLQQWVDSRWPGTLAIVEYRQTHKEGDDQRYTVQYEAKARFLKDTQGCVTTCCGEVCFDKFLNGFRWISKATRDPNDIRKGDLISIQGKDTYAKTDNVWSCIIRR